MQNYFALFALEVDFLIDLDALESAYQREVSKFHPDKFATKSEREQFIAVQNTALINTAYQTLKSPLLRATHCLAFKNIDPFDEKDRQMDADFLSQQIALREALMQQTDSEEMERFMDKIHQLETQNISNIADGFRSNQLEKVKNLVRELKFYEQLKQQAYALEDAL